MVGIRKCLPYMVQDFLFWMKVHWIYPTCIPNTRLGIQLWIWFCQLKDHGNISILSNARNFNSSRWPIYIINSVDKTKLACYTSPPTQYNSFIKNLAALRHLNWLKINSVLFCLSIYLFVNLLISFIQNLFLQYDSELR